MTTRKVLGASLLVAVVLLGVATFRGPVADVAAQQPQASADAALAALTGTVGSAEERRMEGVLVSAKWDGSTRIITVVSNADPLKERVIDRLYDPVAKMFRMLRHSE